MLLVIVVEFALNVIEFDCNVLLPNTRRKVPCVVPLNSSRCTSVFTEGTTVVCTSTAVTGVGAKVGGVGGLVTTGGGMTTGGAIVVEIGGGASALLTMLLTVLPGDVTEFCNWTPVLPANSPLKMIVNGPF